MRRTAIFIYGVFCYVAFLGTFAYAVGFLADTAVPRSVNSGPAAPVWAALSIDMVLLGLFAAQHSGMARQAFKRRLSAVVPAAAERSTFVLASSLVLALLFWQWRPIPAEVWSVAGSAGRAALWALFAAGWMVVLLGTFMISHAHLFGLAQVRARLRGARAPEPKFQTRMLYRHVRHPLMLGFLIAFWATPDMTAGHLLFAAASTGYILVATVTLEERDLERFIGEPYRRYRKRVPAFIPRPGRSVDAEELLDPGREPGTEEPVASPS